MRFRFLLLLICIFISLTNRAQTKTDVTGNWQTVQVLVEPGIKKKDPAAAQRVAKAMMDTKFQFKSDGTCNVTNFPMPFKNSRWTFNEKEKSIDITGEVDGEKGLMMQITVSQKNNKWYFAMSETPVTLEVQKSAAGK